MKPTRTRRMLAVSIIAIFAVQTVSAQLVAAKVRPADPWNFNGDRVGDLAIGAPLEAIGESRNAGAVTTLRGSSAGLRAPGKQWTVGTRGVKGKHSSLFGLALASGDYDRDGHADLATGSEFGRGRVHVLYGSATGLTAKGDELLVPTENTDVWWGSQLAAGDFDGDGYDDLAVGAAPECTLMEYQSSVTVFFGSSKGLDSGRPTRIDNGDPEWDAFGCVLAAGDVNGDGRDDLAITTLDQPVPQGPVSSAVVLVRGTKEGLDLAGRQRLESTSASLAVPGATYQAFGSALAIGDIDGDRRSELMIGIPSATPAGAPAESGAVLVLRGSAAGVATSGRRLLWPDLTGVTGRSEAYAKFGSSVAVGNLGGKRGGDLAIGAPWASAGGVKRAGAVWVFYGSSRGPALGSAQRWSQHSRGVPGAAEDGDLYGYDVQITDVGRGRTADLVVGVVGEDVKAVIDAGAVSVLYGSRHGVTRSHAQSWTQDSRGVRGAAEPDDGFGNLGLGRVH